ncbi:MAG: hypothetical protein AABW49_00730 [Nanoarchaeota archaeon]
MELTEIIANLPILPPVHTCREPVSSQHLARIKMNMPSLITLETHHILGRNEASTMIFYGDRFDKSGKTTSYQSLYVQFIESYEILDQE